MLSLSNKALNMENIKYLAFYALLLVIIVLGVMKLSWLIIFPAALVLSLAYIAVKGSSWRQVMGQTNMHGGAVFIAVFISQIVTATLFYGIGRLVSMVLN